MPIPCGPFEIQHAFIQLVPSFYGQEYENSFKDVDALLEIYSTVSLNNVSSAALCLHLFHLDAEKNITS